MTSIEIADGGVELLIVSLPIGTVATWSRVKQGESFCAIAPIKTMTTTVIARKVPGTGITVASCMATTSIFKQHWMSTAASGQEMVV